MPIFGSDSFAVPGEENAGLAWPHPSDQGVEAFEHADKNFIDTYILAGSGALSAIGYNTGRKPGRLLFDLGDGIGGLEPQINRCIKFDLPVDTNDYEAEIDVWLDPVTMHAEGVIALRALDGVTPYNMAFAGLQWIAGGGALSLNFVESDGDILSNSIPFGTLPMGAGMRKIRLLAQIETVGAEVQVTAFVDGLQVGDPVIVGQDFTVPLANMEFDGEVFFVIQPTDDGTVPVGSDAYIGPFSKIEVSYYGVGTIGSLLSPHKEGTVLPPFFDWYNAEDEQFFPLLLPTLTGVGIPDGVGVMLDPYFDYDNPDDAEGGIMLPLLGGSGTGESVDLGPNEIYTMGGVLPKLVVKADFAIGYLWRFDVILPQLQPLMYFGSKNNIALPMPIVGMGVTIPNNMRFDGVLPMLRSGLDDDSVWHGSVGFVWQFTIELPLISTTARMGSMRFTVRLPMLKITAGQTGVWAECGALTSLSLNVKLPRLKVHGVFTTPQTGLRGFAVLPPLAMSNGLTGVVLLPVLRASMHLSTAQVAGILEVRRGWAMNLQNSAVTEFDNFEFRAMAFAYNKHYGVGMDGGFYRMGGDTDAGVPIAWKWESGMTDLGINAQKGLLALYVDGRFGKDTVFSIEVDDTRREYGHKFRGDMYNHKPHRVTLGKGVRTCNVVVGMADASGNYLELDKITPEYVVTRRNV